MFPKRGRSPSVRRTESTRERGADAQCNLGFTLVELLVVLSVVGLLLALIIPAVLNSREAARRFQCLRNLNQIGIGVHNYSSTYGCFPLGNSTTGGFLVAILPYIDQRPLYDAFQGPGQGTVMAVNVGVYICPSDSSPIREPLGTTNYAGNQGTGVQKYGYNGAFALFQPVRPSDFTDGTSSTAAVCEWLIGPVTGLLRDAKRSVFMTSKPLMGPGELDLFAAACRDLDPSTAALSPATVGRNWAGGDFGRSLYNHVETINRNSCTNGSAYQEGAWTAKSAHPAGANLLYADGHAAFVKETIDPALWRALGSRNGGELRHDIP